MRLIFIIVIILYQSTINVNSSEHFKSADIDLTNFTLRQTIYSDSGEVVKEEGSVVYNYHPVTQITMSVYVCLHSDEHILLAKKNKYGVWFKGGSLEFHKREGKHGDGKVFNEWHGAKVSINEEFFCIYPHGYYNIPGLGESPGAFITNNPGQSVLPGGKSQNSHNILEATITEFFEETGYDITPYIYEGEIIRNNVLGRLFISDHGVPFCSLYIKVDDLESIAGTTTGLLNSKSDFTTYLDAQKELIKQSIKAKQFVTFPNESPQPPMSSDELESVILTPFAEILGLLNASQNQFEEQLTDWQKWFRDISGIRFKSDLRWFKEIIYQKDSSANSGNPPPLQVVDESWLTPDPF